MYSSDAWLHIQNISLFLQSSDKLLEYLKLEHSSIGILLGSHGQGQLSDVLLRNRVRSLPMLHQHGCFKSIFPKGCPGCVGLNWFVRRSCWTIRYWYMTSSKPYWGTRMEGNIQSTGFSPFACWVGDTTSEGTTIATHSWGRTVCLDFGLTNSNRSLTWYQEYFCRY